MDEHTPSLLQNPTSKLQQSQDTWGPILSLPIQR